MKPLYALLPLIDALYRGRQLAHVETWKVAGTAVAALSAFLTALAGIATAMGWLDAIPAQTILEVSSAIVTLVFTVLGYLQVATTEKIGLADPPADDPDAGRVHNKRVPPDDPRGAFGDD